MLYGYSRHCCDSELTLGECNVAKEATRSQSEDWFLLICWRSGFTCSVIIDKREGDKEGEKRKKDDSSLRPICVLCLSLRLRLRACQPGRLAACTVYSVESPMADNVTCRGHQGTTQYARCWGLFRSCGSPPTGCCSTPPTNLVGGMIRLPAWKRTYRTVG